MIRKASILVALAAIAASMSGCAGSGSEQGVDFGAFAGNFNAAFARATGTITITVDATGLVSVVVNDSVEGVFQGSGSANHVGGFFITCQGKNNKTLTVSGTLKGSGVGRTASGTVAGAITVPYNAGFTSAPDATLWTNHYEGSWQVGTESGNLLGDVASNGAFTGQLLLPSGTVDMTGNVYTNGSVNFTGTSGGKTYSMQGALRLAPPSQILGAGLLKVTSGGTTTVGDFQVHNATGG